MRLPDKLQIEYDEYEQQMFIGNEHIYDVFNSSQVWVLKQYFRWRTKTKFQSLVSGTVLEFKPKKGEKLLRIMGEADDWEYDGCVDYGYVGGAQCELGHNLRYAHYAYSAKLNREIIFGSTCASDFFSIPANVLKKISQVQEYTLEDIKLISFLVATGRTMWLIEKYYMDLFDIVGAFPEEGEVDRVFGHDWNEMMANFWKAGLPFTVPLINRIEKVRTQKYLPKVERQKEIERLRPIIGDNESTISILKNNNTHLVQTTGKYIIDASKELNEHLLKCCKYLVNQAVRFDNMCNKLFDMGVLINPKDITKLEELAVFSVAYVDAPNGKRIATKNEFKHFGVNCDFKTIKLLSDDKIRLVNALLWAVGGNNVYYKRLTGSDDGSEYERIERTAKDIRDLLDWIESGQFRIDISRAIEEKQKYEYPEHAEDEIDPYDEQKRIMVGLKDTFEKYEFKGIRIIDTCKGILSGDVTAENLTPNQTKALSKGYKLLNEDSGELIVKLVEILNIDERLKAKLKLDFASQVAETVGAYGNISPKQRAIIDKAYDKIVENREKENKAKEKKDKKGNKKKDSEPEVPVGNIEAVSKDDKEITNDGFPSLESMSDALGSGKLSIKLDNN
jgi:hypothetical protein